MQKMNWNDYRYILAIKRGGSLTEAARIMKVDATTVSRRLAVISDMAKQELWERTSDGRLKLTEIGNQIVSNIESMETEAENLTEILSRDESECIGKLRITSVPIIINRLLVPNIGPFCEKHPNLQIDLIPDSRNFNLNHREADIAIRLARPTQGGNETLARRISDITYSPYVSKTYSLIESNQLDWIGYDEDMSHIPTAMWIEEFARSSGEKIAATRIEDTESAIQAVQAGLGKSFLPDIIASQITSLRPLDQTAKRHSREVWLLSRKSQTKSRRISEASKWIEAAFSGSGHHSANE